MAIEIKAWQIINNRLEPLDNALTEEGHKEIDLQKWINSYPEILGEGIKIIGEKVRFENNIEADLIGIDKSGNIIVIELKRNESSRDTLAQAIDYASAISSLDIEFLDEICLKKNGKKLDELLKDELLNDDININIEQPKIMIISFSIDRSLERMVEWLSNNFYVPINAICLKYIKTSSGDECILKTSIISEDTVEENVNKKRGIRKISDEPGNYSNDELKIKLKNTLKEQNPVFAVIKELLKLCLTNDTVKIDQLKNELIKKGLDNREVGSNIGALKRTIRTFWRDDLRQIISYEKIDNDIDNFKIKEEYKDLVKQILDDIR